MSKLQNFMDKQGRLVQWPAKRSIQLEAIAYFAEKFEYDRDYTETEVNDLLDEWHTFHDTALLRRELIVLGELDRVSNCSRYWRVKKREEQ